MTKQEFLRYIEEAVDAMDGQNFNQLFTPSNQPDLYTLLEGLTGLRGEMKKISKSSLLLQNEVRQLVADLKNQAEANTVEEVKVIEQKPDKSDHDLRYLLRELIKMQPTVLKTADNLNSLPEPGVFNMSDYKKNFAAWKVGFDLFKKQWKSLVKSTGMYETGKENTQFNPEYHEAVATRYESDKTENTILETVQIGYLFKDKVIQEAKVVVNKKK